MFLCASALASAQARAQLEEAEAAMSEGQNQWDEYNQNANEPARQAEVEMDRVAELEGARCRGEEGEAGIEASYNFV